MGQARLLVDPALAPRLVVECLTAFVR